ncbi:MAG: hypothetical protein HPY62_04865 [Bacteroidales bacterium]|nr:hypothetical protein [Bacteroidales bacterium]
MYHVIGTGLTTTLLYLISYLLYRNGFYSLNLHRKIWNSVLAIVFLLTAAAGVFLALQISYKWNIPITRSILKWHVETGIGLSFTGLFHFLWHLKYFIKTSGRQEKQATELWLSEYDNFNVSINLFITGFVSTSLQILMMKEIINISGGYELVAGTFLGSWLIGSGAGAYLAGKSNINDVRKINLFFAFSPVVSIILLFSLSKLFLQTGETPTFLVSMVLTILVLFPFCFISGFTFIKLIAYAKSSMKLDPGKSFSVETTGGIAAGIVVTFLGTGALNTYQTILLIILLAVTYVLLTFFIKNIISVNLFRLLVLTASILIIVTNSDVFFRQLLMQGVKVSKSEETPYGNITIAEYGGEKSIYYNQRLLSYNDDVTEREEDIHYAMLQRERIESVLMISGLLWSHLPEILKYPVKKVVYVESDPSLIKYEQVSVLKQFEGIEVRNEDAYRYIQKSQNKFDVVLLILPPPSTLQLSRFYSVEFFSSVHEKLNPGGVFMCSAGINTNYFNKESIYLNSSVFNSLSSVFRNVKPILGNKIYFLASNDSLSAEICSLSEKRGIKNTYVSPDFLSDELIIMKSDEFLSLLDVNISKNFLTKPLAALYYQSFHLSKKISEKLPAIFFLIIVFLLPAAFIKRRSNLMYFSAFALAGYEIVLLLVLQLTAGNMYQLTGIIIAGFMAGLAMGSGMNFFSENKSRFALKIIALMAFYAICGLLVQKILIMKSFIPVVILIFILSFIPSLLTGNIFRELTRHNVNSSEVSIIYTSDLAGSALGFIFFSAVVVPLIGLRYSMLLITVIVLAGFVSLFATKNRHF